MQTKSMMPTLSLVVEMEHRNPQLVSVPQEDCFSA